MVFFVDMDKVDISREEFLSLIIRNKIFSIVSDNIDEVDKEDKDFNACLNTLYFLF